MLDSVAKHLATMGIKLRYKLNPTVATRDIEEAQAKLGLELPDSYTAFITRFANGFDLSWRAKRGPSASFEMSSLQSSCEGLLGMRDWRVYDEAGAREYGFPFVDDSELALHTNRRMRNWLPVHAVGNGDFFSIDLNPGGCGKLIFDQHDWLDGGTGNNGCVMSEDLPSFLESWAGVCFSQPRSLWWMSVIGSSGVTWGSDEFDDRFRVDTWPDKQA